MSDLQPIETAPKDGTVIYVETVGGGVGEPLLSGKVSWRGVKKLALFDPLSGERCVEERIMTGWMLQDGPFRVPGKIVGWRES